MELSKLNPEGMVARGMLEGSNCGLQFLNRGKEIRDVQDTDDNGCCEKSHTDEGDGPAVLSARQEEKEQCGSRKGQDVDEIVWKYVADDRACHVSAVRFEDDRRNDKCEYGDAADPKGKGKAVQKVKKHSHALLLLVRNHS